jgi:hypothetical protein
LKSWLILVAGLIFHEPKKHHLFPELEIEQLMIVFLLEYYNAPYFIRRIFLVLLGLCLVPSHVESPSEPSIGTPPVKHDGILEIVPAVRYDEATFVFCPIGNFSKFVIFVVLVHTNRRFG